MYFLLVFLWTCAFSAGSGAAFAAVSGEVYSESNYVPQYGLLTESILRVHLYKDDHVTSYVGAAMQAQNKTKSAQDDLYDKNRTMALIGARIPLWKSLTALLEARTEDRSRVGVFAGDIWQYELGGLNVFTEFYAESLVMTSFHRDPVSTGWLKHGLRFKPFESLLVDPFAEAYVRRSPSPDLGRDTEQARLGVRTIYFFGAWSASLLVYESFPHNETPHEEALFVLGGSF